MMSTRNKGILCLIKVCILKWIDCVFYQTFVNEMSKS